jgi:hypothetical protein
MQEKQVYKRFKNMFALNFVTLMPLILQPEHRVLKNLEANELMTRV